MKAQRALRLVGMVAASVCSWSAARAHAAPRELPPRLRVVLERCAALPFDADAYLQALDVELVSLGVGEPPAQAAAPELHVRAPACDARLTLELRAGGATQRDALRSDELPGEGRERALALATVERLTQSWHALREQAALAPRPPAPAGMAPSARALPARAVQAPRSLRTARGALDAALSITAPTPAFGLGLTLDTALAHGLAYGGSLAFVVRPDGDDPRDTRAYALTLGPRLELSLFGAGAFELVAGAGVRAGVAWVVTERELGTGRVTSSPAPLLLGAALLGVRAALGQHAFVQAGLALDYALLGARFLSASAAPLGGFTGAVLGGFAGLGTRFGR